MIIFFYEHDHRRHQVNRDINWRETHCGIRLESFTEPMSWRMFHHLVFMHFCNFLYAKYEDVSVYVYVWVYTRARYMRLCCLCLFGTRAVRGCTYVCMCVCALVCAWALTLFICSYRHACVCVYVYSCVSVCRYISCFQQSDSLNSGTVEPCAAKLGGYDAYQMAASYTNVEEIAS